VIFFVVKRNTLEKALVELFITFQAATDMADSGSFIPPHLPLPPPKGNPRGFVRVQKDPVLHKSRGWILAKTCQQNSDFLSVTAIFATFLRSNYRYANSFIRVV
jgi:hypothetical protein